MTVLERATPSLTFRESSGNSPSLFLSHCEMGIMVNSTMTLNMIIKAQVLMGLGQGSPPPQKKSPGHFVPYPHSRACPTQSHREGASPGGHCTLPLQKSRDGLLLTRQTSGQRPHWWAVFPGPGEHDPSERGGTSLKPWAKPQIQPWPIPLLPRCRSPGSPYGLAA